MMTILFWTLATLLIAATLYSLLRPLIRRFEQDDTAREVSLVEIYRERLLQLDQQHQRGDLDTNQLTAARAELEASLALELPEHETPDSPSSSSNRKALPILVGLGVPLLAIVLYLALGTPAAIDGTANRNNANETQLSIDEMVSQLERRLQANPDDAQGWIMLGRSYTVLNQLPNAREAYLQAVERSPANAEVLFNLAEVTAALQNNTLIGEPENYLQLGLQLNPQSRQGRWLLGILAYQQGDSQKAATLWEQLLAESGNPEEQEMLRSFIQEAKSVMSEEAAAQIPAAASTPAESTAPLATDDARPQVTVNVSLADNLAAKVSANDTLFVYAKAAAGPPMPLAIVRTTVGELPLRVTLDDSQAMMPQMKLSAFNQVVINARVSKTGDATPSSGDLLGLSQPVNPADNPSLEVVIDSVVP